MRVDNTVYIAISFCPNKFLFHYTHTTAGQGGDENPRYKLNLTRLRSLGHGLDTIAEADSLAEEKRQQQEQIHRMQLQLNSIDQTLSILLRKVEELCQTFSQSQPAAGNLFGGSQSETQHRQQV